MFALFFGFLTLICLFILIDQYKDGREVYKLQIQVLVGIINITSIVFAIIYQEIRIEFS